MKILIVSGFLGAGKTTFIKALAEKTHKDFAILENEYGETGVDGSLLNDSSSSDTAEKINIWELTEGCICCSMKKDFSASVLTIANAVDPEYLVVEPTGVGKPGNIIENLKPILYERITLLAPITVIDGNLFDLQSAEFADIYIDQIRTADKILVSKMENASTEELSCLNEKIKSINSNAEIFLSHYSNLAEDKWQEFLQKDFSGKIISEQTEQKEDFESIGLNDVSLESENLLIFLLERAVRGELGEVVRAKGFLKAGNQWLKFDVTQNRYAITGIEEQKESRCVFIGKNLAKNKIRKLLHQSYFSKNNNSPKFSDSQFRKK